jgi:hypothetical protein
LDEAAAVCRADDFISNLITAVVPSLRRSTLPAMTNRLPRQSQATTGSDNGASTNNRAERRYSPSAVLRCACQHQWIDDAADDYVVCIHLSPECQWLMKIAHVALYTRAPYIRMALIVREWQFMSAVRVS